MNQGTPYISACCLCGRVRVRYLADVLQDPEDWHMPSHGYCPECMERVKGGLMGTPLALLLDQVRRQPTTDLMLEVVARLHELAHIAAHHAHVEREANGLRREAEELRQRIAGLQSERAANVRAR